MKRGKFYSNSKRDIPLILDSYEDLFSDFDPRHYSEKALSKDFIFECQKASEDKKGDINIKFLMKKERRDAKEEGIIIHRIKDHFHKHFIEKRKELLKIKLIGLFWFILGCLLIVFTTLFTSPDDTYIVKILIAISHPAGWFFLWEGMGKILIHSKEKKEEYIFHKKMDNAKISFLNN
jgi:hypothetical protein